jgi:hypothetical protein
LQDLCPNVQYIGSDFQAPLGDVSFPFYQCDFNYQALPADLMDLELIICSGLLERIANLREFMEQLRDRLAPDGQLIVTWPSNGSHSDFERLLTEAGLELTQALAATEETLVPLNLARQSSSSLMPHQFLYCARRSRTDHVPVDEITKTIPPGSRFILIDEALWSDVAFPERTPIPFIEREGQYWGPPADDAQAICELQRLHKSGADFVVFAPSAYWFLDYYTEFARYLDITFNRVAKNHRLTVFDLRTPRPTDI